MRLALGLWRTPRDHRLRINDPVLSAAKVRAAVVGAVLLTTVAGLSLTWLRVESGGLLGPIVLHAGVNSVAALAAAFALREIRADQLSRSVREWHCSQPT